MWSGALSALSIKKTCFDTSPYFLLDLNYIFSLLFKRAWHPAGRLSRPVFFHSDIRMT